MDNLENDAVKIHQELINQETSLHLALKQSGMTNIPLLDRILSAAGDALIRLGTRLKGHTMHRLAPEEASAPTYIIML